MPPKDLPNFQFCEIYVNGMPLGKATQDKISFESPDSNRLHYNKPIEIKTTMEIDPNTSDELQKIMESSIPSELFNMLQKINSLSDQYHREKWQGRRHRREIQRQYDKLLKRFDYYCKIYGVTYSVAH